jgi:enoyl-CoA hydratase/carnithine racemase
MDEVVVECKDSILRIQLNRPAKLNAFDRAMYTAFADALERAAKDDDVHVVLVHGAGPSFSAGNDLKDFAEHPSELEPQARFIDALISFDKPIVAAVHGVAVGIGTTMLMHCDFVYAGESARFQTPFADLGLVPEAGSTYLLPAQMAYHAAAELVLSGRPMHAARAAELGLATAVVPDASLLATATETARELAAKPAAALQACKRLLRARAVEGARIAAKNELREFAARLKSDDTKRAIAAFFEKRRPAKPPRPALPTQERSPGR